jgi:AraC-like DNA-binding protein
MRLALGLLDITAIKRSAREGERRDTHLWIDSAARPKNIDQAKKRLEVSNLSAQLRNNENSTFFNCDSKYLIDISRPQSSHCLKRHIK